MNIPGAVQTCGLPGMVAERGREQPEAGATHHDGRVPDRDVIIDIVEDRSDHEIDAGDLPELIDSPRVHQLPEPELPELAEQPELPELAAGRARAAERLQADIAAVGRIANERTGEINFAVQFIGHMVAGAVGGGLRMAEVSALAGGLGGLGAGLAIGLGGGLLGELQFPAIVRGDARARLFQNVMQGLGATCGAIAGAVVTDRTSRFEGGHAASTALALAATGSVVVGSIGARLADSLMRRA